MTPAGSGVAGAPAVASASCSGGYDVAKTPSPSEVVPPPVRCTTTLKGVVPPSVMS